MKNIREPLGLGLAGMLAAAIMTLALSASPDYQPWSYHYFKLDYAKAGWVYDRAIGASRPTDNLFMGSSHILNAVNDTEVAQQLGGAQAAYNAAIPTSARNLQFAVIRDIFERNKPQRLFLEVRETEERTSHFGFPILARETDIVRAPLNPWWLRDFLSMLQYRFAFLISKLPLAQPQPPAQPAPEFGYITNNHQIAHEELAQQAQNASREKRWRWLPAVFGDLEFRANKVYLRQIAQLCRENGVELHFLYLPFVGAPREPADADFYRTIGTLHLLPEFISQDIVYWADVTHFNPKGAAAYTQDLIDTVLKPNSAASVEHQTPASLSR